MVGGNKGLALVGAGAVLGYLVGYKWWSQRARLGGTGKGGPGARPCPTPAEAAGVFGGRWEEEVAMAVGMALECGGRMLRCTEEQRNAQWKDESEGGIDPVTQTDQDNEELVATVIASKYPTHRVIGEEACAESGHIPGLSSEPTWIVDPIDGTQNFVHGVPMAVVSIGFCDKGVPVMGVVYDPYRDELFTAVAGKGAYLNNSPISCTTSADSLPRAMVLSDVGYERTERGVELMAAAFKRLLCAGTQGLRIVGSTVLALSWVACGRVDAFTVGSANEGGKPWDYCAAYVIAKEAGAVFERIDPRSHSPDSNSTPSASTLLPFDIYSRSIVCAGNPSLAQELLEVMRG